METSQEDHDQERHEEEAAATYDQYNSYSPCSYIQQVARAFLRCLGLDYSTTGRATTSSTPSEAETGTRSNEERAVMQFSITSITVRGTPQRPPISSGGGGQTN